VPGPTLFVSGPLLAKDPRPGTDAWRWTVSDAEDARAKVLRLAEAGVDYLLLDDLALWTDEELAAVVGEARLRGLPVEAMAGREAAIARAVEAGVDGLQGVGLDPAAGYPQDLYRIIERRAHDSGVRRLTWSPGISGVFNFQSLQKNPEPLDDPATVAGLPPVVVADLIGPISRFEGSAWYEMPAVRAPTLCTKLRQLDMAGARLVVGSDAGAPAHLHSRATWQEIDAWVRDCGIDPVRAIQAATHEAAAAMRVEHLSGTIAPGKVADIIAVRGDLLRHPALLQRVELVVSRGLRHR
jgi:hypothetical protein